MKIDYSYNCSYEEAYNRIDSFLDGLANEYSDMISNQSREWNDSKDKMNFSFDVKGFSINGNIQLKENGLTLEGEVPFPANLFEGKIRSTIESKLDDLF